MKIIDNLSEINLNQDVFPIFFWDKWKVVEEQLHHKQRLLCVDEEENVIAFTLYKMQFFKKADYLYAPLDKNGNRLPVEKEKTFLDDFHDYLKRYKIADVIFPPSHISLFKCIPAKVVYYQLGLLYVDLSRSEEDIYSDINSRNRRYIKQCQSQKLFTDLHSNDINSLYACLVETNRKEGVGTYPREYYRVIKDILSDNCDIAVIKNEQGPLSSVFLLNDVDNVYACYAGTFFSKEYSGANKLLYWKMYQEYKSHGHLKFIYGGYRYGLTDKDKLFNVQEFKLRMGAKIEDGYHFIKMINPFKYNLVNFAMKCKSILTGKNYSFVNLKGLDVKKSK